MEEHAMKKIWLVVILSIAVLAIFLAAKDATYVGASACKLCHKAELQGRQYVIWEASLHAKSYASLTTPKALEVAKSMGASDPPENAQCLGCHAPLAAKAPELKTEGVTCEVCHGAGSGYRKLPIMQDKANAVQNGLILYPDSAAIQAHCMECHQNPHGKAFDFKAAWETIKHPVPAK
jgi:hypothetical protein